MARITAVLFDLDGTLLDRRETFRRHLELQIQRRTDLFGAKQGSAYVARLLALDENGMIDRDEFFNRVETELELGPDAALRLRDDFETHYPESCVAFPNVHETLAALREVGLTIGLITNGRVVIQSRKIDGLGIRPLLDGIVISEAAGFRKPDPRIFARAIAELGIASSAAAFVGDNPDTDIMGARQSGLRPIWKRDDFWSEPAEADWIIDDLSELTSIVASR